MDNFNYQSFSNYVNIINITVSHKHVNPTNCKLYSINGEISTQQLK